MIETQGNDNIRHLGVKQTAAMFVLDSKGTFRCMFLELEFENLKKLFSCKFCRDHPEGGGHKNCWDAVKLKLSFVFNLIVLYFVPLYRFDLPLV